MSSAFTLKETIHNGIEIPIIGYRIDSERGHDNYNHILKAINNGFRHLDIPCDPEIEKIAGKAIKDSGVPRYEFFLTLKVPNSEHGYQRTLRSFENSCKRMDIDYADLYLVDWPNPLKYRDTYEETAIETWKAMETLYKSGKVHAIGLANFEARHIEFCLEHSEISPMFNQARIYPGFPFIDNLDCARKHKIMTEGYLPPLHDDILNSNELEIFAKKYGTTPRNICIAYLLHKGCLALAQGFDDDELKQCGDAFNIVLKDEDMLFLDNMKNYGVENIDPDTCDF